MSVAGSVAPSQAASYMEALSQGGNAPSTADFLLGRKRGAGQNDAEQQRKSRKQRAKIRQLRETRTLGYLYNDVLLGSTLGSPRIVDMFPFLKNVRPARFMRSERDQTGHKDEYGPCALYDEFVQNTSKMLRHAQITHRSIFENFHDAKRYLDPESEVEGMQMLVDTCQSFFENNEHITAAGSASAPRASFRPDWESKLLNCLQITNDSMNLFKPRDPAVSSIFWPQPQMDLQAQIKVWGDDGGFAGAGQCSTFYMIGLDHEGRSVPTALLQIITLLAQGLRGGWSATDCNQWPACSTHFTEVQGFHTHKKRISGVRICTSDIQRRTKRRHYDQCLDIDAELYDKIALHYEQKLAEGMRDQEHNMAVEIPIIRNPLANANKSQNSDKNDDVLNNVSAQHFFEMFLISRFIQATDHNGIRHVVKIDMLRIHPRFVGIDAIVAIKNCLQALPELTAPLKHVLDHMAELLRGDNSFRSIGQLFACSTSDDIVDLLNEDGLHISLARFASKNNITLHGAAAFDLHQREDIKTLRACIDAVNVWRRHQYHEILRESESEMSKPHLKDYPYTPFSPDDAEEREQDADDSQTEPIPLIGDISFHWRSVPKCVMNAIAMTYITNATKDIQNSEIRKQELLSEYMQWIYSHPYQEQGDDGLLYFPVAGCAVSDGVYIKIDMQGFSPNEKPSASNRDSDGNKAIQLMMQPTMASPCIAQYVSSHLDSAGNSHFACFFEDPACIPDRDYILENYKSMPPYVWSLHEHMRRDNITYIEYAGENGRQQLLEETLQQCYGLKTHPFITKYLEMVLHSDADMTNMRAVLGASFRCFYSSYEDTLGMIASCCFDQYRHFAAYLITLDQHARKQSKMYTSNLSRLYRRLGIQYSTAASKPTIDAPAASYDALRALQEKLLRNSEISIHRQRVNAIVTCNEDNLLSMMYETSIEELNIRLCWWNRLVDANMSLSAAALFGYNSSNTTWGYFIQLSDLGNSMLCITNEPIGKRHSYIRNSKGPSAGADQTAAANSMLNKIHAMKLIKPENSQIANFYSTAGSDITAKTTSPQGWAMLNGSSVIVKAGKIQLDRNVTRSMGLFSVYLEGGKTDASNSRTTTELATMESFLGNSGKSCYMQESNWVSGGSEHKDIIKGNDLPVIERTSNRQNDQEPESLKKGGRTKEIAAGVLDHLGRSMYSCSGGNDKDKHNDDSVTAPDADSIQQCGMAGGIRFLTDQDCQRSPLPLLLRMLLRHMAYMQRTMTIPFVDTNSGEGEYTFHLSQQRLSAHIRMSTQHLRRYYFDVDETTASRTFDGAFCTSTLNPMHLQALAWKALTKACIVEPEAPPLRSAARDVLHGLLICPPSVNTIFGSLYLWLSQTVLDINTMIIACFCLQMAGFQQHCPIRVIAMVARGLEAELSKEDIAAYDALAAFLARIFCSHRGSSSNDAYQLATRGSILAMSEPEIRACFPTSQPQRRQAFSYDNPNNASAPPPNGQGNNNNNNDDNAADDGDKLKECNALYEQRSTISSNQFQVPYVIPNCSFETTSMPEFIEFRSRRDDFNYGTSDTMLAEIFAQTQVEEQSDKHAAAASTTKQQKKPHNEFQNFHDFWKMAGQGTRLQTKMESSNDLSNKTAMPCQATGKWFTSNMSSASDNKDKPGGILCDFLLLCGLPPDSNTLTLVETIMRLYLEKNKDMTLKNRFRDPSFQQPIYKLDLYKWYAMPCPTQPSGGIDVRIGMQVAWMILAQALYTKEWSGPRKTSLPSHDSNSSNARKYPTVLHLRNMGHAAAELLFIHAHLRTDKAVLPREGIAIAMPDPRAAKFHSHSTDTTKTVLTDAPIAVVIPIVSNLHNNSWHGTLSRGVRDAGALRQMTPPERKKAQGLTFDPYNVLTKRFSKDMHLIKLHLENSQGIIIATDGNSMAFAANYHIANVDRRCSNSHSAAVDDIFPYPPESVAHMQGHHILLQRCWRAFVRANFRAKFNSDNSFAPNNDNQALDSIAVASAFSMLPAAFRLAFEAVDMDSVNILSVSLTSAFMHNSGIGVEMPCVFNKHGLMCSLRMDATTNTVSLSPVEPTHTHFSQLLIDEGIDKQPWQTTPIAGNRKEISFPLHLLNYALSHGLYLLTCRENQVPGIVFRPPTQQLPSSDLFEIEHVVLTPWPAIHFNQLLLCTTSGKMGFHFDLDDGAQIRLVRPDEFFHEFAQTPHMTRVSARRLSKLNLLDPHSTLYSLNCQSITTAKTTPTPDNQDQEFEHDIENEMEIEQDYDTDAALENHFENCVFFIEQTLPNQRKLYHYYINLHHLQHDLSEFSGYPDPHLEFEQTTPNGAMLFCMSPTYDPFDPETFEMFPLRNKPGSQECTVDICEYSTDNESVEKLKAEIESLKAAKHNFKNHLEMNTKELRRLESTMSAYPDIIEEKKNSIAKIEDQLNKEKQKLKSCRARLKACNNKISKRVLKTHTLPADKLFEPGNLTQIIEPYNAEALQFQTIHEEPLDDVFFACVRRYQSRHVCRNGSYTVAFSALGNENNYKVALTKFDFITSARAIFPEGSSCDIICNGEIFLAICSQLKVRVRLSLMHSAMKASLPQPSEMQSISEACINYLSLCADSAEDSTQRNAIKILDEMPVRIQAFYVLSDAESYDAPMTATPKIALRLGIQGAPSQIIYLSLFRTGNSTSPPEIIVPSCIGSDQNLCVRDSFEVDA